MSAWVLPDHIADVLPLEARLIEDLRRELLDTARSYGYELVIPPLVEHIESLLTGSGEDLDLQTFKLIDQLSGRMLGIRADTTQQTARIDAHLLNRQGVSRLCYCGPVLHTRPQQAGSSREPLQFGAELYGCNHLAADTEIVLLALDILQATGITHQQPLVLDLADARIVPALLEQAPDCAVNVHHLQQALITKNAEALSAASRTLPAAVQAALQALPSLYGSSNVLEQARHTLPALPAITQALDELDALSAQVHEVCPDVRIQFDLADSLGYSYYSGMRFAIYVQSSCSALVRGGRYDEVGAAFGRTRPAVGFGLDVKALAAHTAPRPLRAAIRAPWHPSAAWQQAVHALRQSGQTVLVPLPGQEHVPDAFLCDRPLVENNGQWLLQKTA